MARQEDRRISVSDYLKRFSDTKNTAINYRVGCATFFLWKYPELKQENRQRIKWTPEFIKRLDDVSLAYVSADEDYTEDLIEFKNHLREKGSAPKSIGIALTALIGYFERNNLNLKTIDKRDLTKGTQKTVTEDTVPTAEQLIKIIDFMPIQGRTLTLLLSSSGVRIGEALQLTIKDVDLTKTPVEVRIRDNGGDRTTKGGESRTAFISAEAKEQLIGWMEYRPNYLSLNTKLSTAPNEDRIFPFTQSNVLQMWTLAVNKAGYGEKDGSRLKLHIHTLRKYFRTRGNWKNPDIAEFLMGHRTGLGPIYNKLEQNRGEVISQYLEAMKHLQVYSRSREVVNLKDEVQLKNEQIDDVIRSMTIQNARLENQVTDLIMTHKTEVSAIHVEMGEMRKMMLEMFAKKSPEARDLAELISLGKTPQQAKAELERQEKEVNDAVKELKESES